MAVRHRLVLRGELHRTAGDDDLGELGAEDFLAGGGVGAMPGQRQLVISMRCSGFGRLASSSLCWVPGIAFEDGTRSCARLLPCPAKEASLAALVAGSTRVPSMHLSTPPGEALHMRCLRMCPHAPLRNVSLKN